MRFEQKLPYLEATGLLFVVLAACGNSGDDTTPNKVDPPAANVEVTALQLIAPCTAQACGSAPSSSSTAKPTCSQVSNACSWATSAPDDSVSYRQCEESECAGTKPDASVCPSGSSFQGAQCGSENEAACAWRSTCTPPPSTTACPDTDGCGGKPELAVICKDGSTGDLVCMQKGASCGWQRTCE